MVYKASTDVHCHSMAHSLTLPTFTVADGFALPAATASPSLRFTVPLLAAEHFRLLATTCGTNCLPPEVTPVSSSPALYLTSLRTRLKTFLFTESHPDIRLIWHFCVHILSMADLAVFYILLGLKFLID